MKWPIFGILVIAFILVQTTVGRLAAFETEAIGTVGPDFLAVLAVFIALRAVRRRDVLIAAWVLGFAVDLTTVMPVVGPVSISFVAAGWVVYSIREAFFHERVLTQALLGGVFCAVAQAISITLQSLVSGWAGYKATLWQAAALTLYTAAVTPLLHYALGRYQRWLIIAPVGRRRRSR